MTPIENKNPNDILKALLDVEDVPQRNVPMDRFGVEFTIQAITGAVLNQIQDQCTYSRVGKGGKQVKQVDEQKLSSMLIEKACVVPNWNDQALKDKYNVFETYEVIGRRLLAGELELLASEIMNLSGFKDPNEKIEEAKN